MPEIVVQKTKQHQKVCVLGGAGGIGQPLSLLMKLSPLVNEVAVYDVEQAFPPAAGVACDLSHINTDCVVKGYVGEAQLGAALTNATVVVMLAGRAQKPGMSRDDLFNTNAQIAKNLAEAIAHNCPKAIILVISNPVNSLIPIIAETLKKHNVYDWRRVTGLNCLDTMRACTFVAEVNKVSAPCQYVPCVGGHAAETIIPLLSQAQPPLVGLTDAEMEQLDKHVMDAAAQVINAKAGAGSATLATATITARFAENVIRGLNGHLQPEICYFNISESDPNFDVEYFATKVLFGPNGIEKVLPLGPVTPYELKRIDAGKAKLRRDIQAALHFVNSNN